MKNKNSFRRALHEILDLILASEAKEYINFIALLGSVREEEAIPAYSDLDILLIIDSDNSGAINKDVLRELRNISEKVSSKYDVRISFLTHTLFDFNEYVDFDYLTHYSWGDVLYGDKNKFRDIFQLILELRRDGEKERRRLIYRDLIHSRFNTIRRYVSLNKHNTPEYGRYITKMIIDNVLEVCNWCLIYKDIFEVRKKDIVQKFLREFPDSGLSYVPQMALKIRNNWNRFNYDAQVQKFVDDSVIFLQDCVRLIHEEEKQDG